MESSGNYAYEDQGYCLRAYGRPDELVGKVAPDEVRDKYIGRSVAKLYKRREVSPVKEFRKD